MFQDLVGSPAVADRIAAVVAIRTMREGREPYLPLLVDLLADPDPEVRLRTLGVFRAAGTVAVPLLR